jgi:hypothetical protein
MQRIASTSSLERLVNPLRHNFAPNDAGAFDAPARGSTLLVESWLNNAATSAGRKDWIPPLQLQIDHRKSFFAWLVH